MRKTPAVLLTFLLVPVLTDASDVIGIKADPGIGGLYRASRQGEVWWFPLTVTLTGLSPGTRGSVRATMLECRAG